MNMNDIETRPRSLSEAAVFQNSYDYTVPYKEYDGKNGVELALEMLGAREAPFDTSGKLRIPAWVGIALQDPSRQGSPLSRSSREFSHVIKRTLEGMGDMDESAIEGVEEMLKLGASASDQTKDYNHDPSEQEVPEIVNNLVADHLVPEEYANLPPSEIAQMFQINPRKPKRPTETQISYTTNAEGRHIIQYATLPQVVKAFSSETQDMVAIQRLILAHEQFVDGRQVFSQFVDFFSLHQSSSPADQIIQARVLNVLKKWIELSWPHMKQCGIEPLMDSFMKDLGTSSPKLKAILEKSIQQTESELLLAKEMNRNSAAPTPLKPKRSKSKHKDGFNLTDFAPLEVARQLTVIDFELVSNVRLHEMVKAQWIDDNAATTLNAASKRVNDLTYWLAYQIVSETNLKKRVKVITHIIKLAKHLLALNSFNSFMAVYLAFNMASTARLTQTWKNVATKHFQLWKKMSKIMSPVNNFKNYRSLLETLQPPMILCQEVLLKDLLYQEEGRPDFVEENVLDMTKMDEVGRLIDQFRQCQLKHYQLNKSPALYQYLIELPTWESAEEAAQTLDELSRIIEPSSINFPPQFSSDPASRVRSLGTLPTWKRDSSLSDQRSQNQFSNPKPTPRAPDLKEEDEPKSPRLLSPRRTADSGPIPSITSSDYSSDSGSE